MNKQVWERFDPNVKELVKLEDVAGMNEAKIEVMEFVDFLKVIRLKLLHLIFYRLIALNYQKPIDPKSYLWFAD